VLRNTNALPAVAGPSGPLDDVPPLTSRPGALSPIVASLRLGGDSDKQSATHVAISPAGAVRRQATMGRGIRAEIVQTTSRNRVELRYRGAWHLLVIYEQGTRREGETFVDSMPPSTLRDFTRKLTFVPAGHDFFEWHQLQSSARLVFVHLDPAMLEVTSAATTSRSLVPRLFFDEAMLCSTVAKLKGLIEVPRRENLPYFEALGAVLMHELVRLNKGTNPNQSAVRGGLAAWQQRLLTAYVEDHLAEHIPLATLAGLARLSPYHFSRAFKQSFGVPPHRYHMKRRIERAKALLGRHALSVTEVGHTLGFSETSSFTATFRKTTGVTPSRYHRSITHPPGQN
jgi:AraC-like DNA-binding protein